VFNVPNAMWTEFGNRLSHGGVQRFNDIVKRLAGLALDTLFGDWPFEQRYGIVSGLQTALLDPTGQLRPLAPVPSLAQLHRPGALQDYCARLGQREAATRAAFVDLKATVETFNDLLAVDWIVIPQSLINGDVNGALRQARDRYRLPRP
jgi:hypothetical protein